MILKKSIFRSLQEKKKQFKLKYFLMAIGDF
jgi:hypothetical protein